MIRLMLSAVFLSLLLAGGSVLGRYAGYCFGWQRYVALLLNRSGTVRIQTDDRGYCCYVTVPGRKGFEVMGVAASLDEAVWNALEQITDARSS